MAISDEFKAGLPRFMDMGSLAKRYGVPHHIVRKWVNARKDACKTHNTVERHETCRWCRSGWMPTVPMPDALRNDGWLLWSADRVGEWDDWLRPLLKRVNKSTFEGKPLNARIPGE